MIIMKMKILTLPLKNTSNVEPRLSAIFAPGILFYISTFP